MNHSAVRCILDSGDRYLLAVHNNYLPETMGKWGLPGGHIEKDEAFETTARREMSEEFGISLAEWQEVADYPYHGFLQKVLATKYAGVKTLSYDRKEILNIAWYSFEEIKSIDEAGNLHTGFELEAISSYKSLRGG